MEKKTECEIVQDLLFGYVDNTLNEESKKLVEKHLSECEACRERLKEIRNDIKENEVTQQKEIDYLKKIRRKSKIKSIFIAIGIILIIVLAIYINKFIKINIIMKNANKTLKAQNYYSERCEFLSNGEISVVTKLYYKDGKYKRVSETYSEDGKQVNYTIYGEAGTDERITLYENTKKAVVSKGDISKIANKEENIKWHRFSEIERNSLFLNLGKAFIMSINTDTYNYGKEYYVLRNQFEQNQRWEIWVDKQTGLVIREVNREGSKTFFEGTDVVKNINDNIQQYKYDFNIVTDEDVKIPDYSSYSIELIDESETYSY